jgi:hypothetical protein
MMRILSIILVVIGLASCGEAKHSNIQTGLANKKNNAYCLTSQSKCNVMTEFGHFEIKFSQESPNQALISDTSSEKVDSNKLHQIKTELPFSIVINSLDKKTSRTISLSGYLEGKDMFMGKIPVFFEESTDNKLFVTTSLLASCSEDIMTWRLWIIVKKNEMVDKTSEEKRFFIEFESLRL